MGGSFSAVFRFLSWGAGKAWSCDALRLKSFFMLFGLRNLNFPFAAVCLFLVSTVIFECPMGLLFFLLARRSLKIGLCSTKTEKQVCETKKVLEAKKKVQGKII
jgi:hypothetical protein